MATPLHSPVSPALYSNLAISLTAVGILFLAYFLVYELTTRKRNIGLELLIALLSSVFLGFGTLFVLLWTGVYV
ncbi:Dolichyl-diphosphooligosaccharide-protein glycosyltransferase subunit OST5 [Balamuthia mandrillaris]